MIYLLLDDGCRFELLAPRFDYDGSLTPKTPRAIRAMIQWLSI